MIAPRRRALRWVAGLVALAGSPARAASIEPRATSHEPRTTRFAPVAPDYRLRFPEDEAAHPAFRTEWWYVTGWLETAGRPAMGFQVTFFRARPEIDERNPSAFTARQIIIAHAALSDPERGRLVHDQTVARAVLGLAGADEQRLRVWIDDWSFTQERSIYRTRVPGRDFTLDLAFTPAQPPLLQGDAGLSRKGPRPESASYYYSVPHLQVAGEIAQSGRKSSVAGKAWLDHEWSSSYMDERATGWDWIGINFDDGGALMAFRMRDAAGAKFWAGGAYRAPDGTRRAFDRADVELTPLRVWQSPRTGTRYPVMWRVRAGAVELTIEPLMDDQENDTRMSVGTIYWEGAVRAMRENKVVGRGYLELTGYWRPLKL